MRLYTYFRSSAAYRVRIALNYKGIEVEQVPKHLVREGGEHRLDDYLALNPQGLVPALEHAGRVIAQSLAILEYLEEIRPYPPLLPREAGERAMVRSLALAVACDIHPLNNLSVLNYLRNDLQATEEQVSQWYCTWVQRGFDAIEQTLAASPGPFCYGDQPTLADVCLVPQVFNADRFEVPMDSYPNIRRVADHCNTLAAFARAAPAVQPDA